MTYVVLTPQQWRDDIEWWRKELRNQLQTNGRRHPLARATHRILIDLRGAR